MTDPHGPKTGLSAGWGILLGMIAIGVIMLLAIIWGIGKVADAVPSTDDLTAIVEPEPFEEVGPTVVRSIRDLANLTTVELVEYTVVEKGVDGGILDWANGDSLQLFAVARIGAGIDLGSVAIDSFSLDPDGVVEVVVPRAEIQYIAVDNEATQILDRQTGLFTRGDPRLESDARSLAEGVLQQAALDEGILEMAEDNARDVITNFLLNLGYSDVLVEFR